MTTMIAKFNGRCTACAGSIQAGDKIDYARDTKARHPGCIKAVVGTPAPARPSHRRGLGAGSAPSVPGYSNYCTDNDYCRCFDCAS